MIYDKVTRELSDKVAKIISVVFSPLLIPVYGMMIIFSAPTLYGYLPFDVKKLLLLIILVNNVLLPVSLLPFFIYRKIISSWAIEKRSERIIPLVIATILYMVTSYIIYRFPVPLFLKSYIITVFFLSLVVTVINFLWKISIHSAGSGALTALVFILSYKMHSPLDLYLITTILISGLVISARLKLNKHNPSQVWLSYLTGFLGFTLLDIFILIFQ
jgi:hypothetical protein